MEDKSLNLYLDEIGREQLLTADEERSSLSVSRPVTAALSASWWRPTCASSLR